MPDNTDDNPFSKTVKDATKPRAHSPATMTKPADNTPTSATTRTTNTKALHVNVSADKFDWVKATAGKNYWTNRTVIELAIDALKEKLGD